MPSFLPYFASLLSDTKPDLLSSAPPGSGLYLKNSSQIFLSSAPPGSDPYLKNSALCLLLSLCFVLMFCVSCRFSQGCTVRGHRECRSNSKSVGVPLIWALENWTTTPITQALFWISPVLLPRHFPFWSLLLSPQSISHPHHPPAALTTMVLDPLLSGPITIVLLCKLFLDVDWPIKCYTRVFLHGNQNCIL